MSFLFSQGGNANYTSMRMIQEMLGLMSSHIRSTMLEEVKRSPVYSLLVDETTDVAVLKQLIIYGRYLGDDKQVCKNV